jgi:hypothetical protein
LSAFQSPFSKLRKKLYRSEAICKNIQSSIKTMFSSAQPLLPLGSLEGFTERLYSKVSVPAGPERFGFQIEVTPSVVLSHTFVSLAEPESAGVDRIGFGVLIDWERREIWDVMNGSGLLGWMDEEMLQERDTVQISLRVERIGNALLPSLVVGGEEWLYPARRSSSALELQFRAGSRSNTSRPVDPSDVFDDAYAWVGRR